LHPHTPRRRLIRPLVIAATCAAVALSASPALAGSGGVGTGSGDNNDGPAGKAKLRNGLAVAPSNAPSRVKQVIAAANDIAKGKPYCYGGGHGSFNDNCYDCSGAVSYALHGGDFVSSPMPSGSYGSWGKRGKGKWITVFANSGHVYAVIAGLRFDTSMTPGEGPGWSNEMRSSSGFRVRHPRNF
jgi:cell wall-associated NlpC family hydrolase